MLVLASATLATGYVTSAGVGDQEYTAGDQVDSPPGPTVIATDSNAWLGGDRSTDPRANAQLLAIDQEGEIFYRNNSHTRYWDVDPVPGTDATVEYVFADHLTPEECGGEEVCTRNGIERVNLSTGNVTRIYDQITPGKHSTRWHDADRLDEHHFVVADIARDRVFVVNTTSELETWAWNAQSHYAPNESGGPYPEDWTHINDVEILDDGRFMVSVRNMDEVVFIERQSGVQQGWTLGEDDDHETIYEQHNPDYISQERGGPAVLVADSENSRVVEYQRSGGEWQQSWEWEDDRLQWARDADRLPSGNTLVADSNGNRVLEIGSDGEVVWAMDVAFPYEAERLGTGDESGGGPAANHAGLANGSGNATSGESDSGGFTLGLDGLIQGPTMNAVMYVLPIWMGLLELGALVIFLLTLLLWGIAELYWTSWRLGVNWPFRIERGG